MLGDVVEHAGGRRRRVREARDLEPERGVIDDPLDDRAGAEPAAAAHRDRAPSVPSVRSSSCSAVVTSRAPVAPTGWPSAIAPPFGLTCSMSGFSSRSHASTTDANASLISIVSMSSIVEPGALEQVPGGVDRTGEHQHRVDADEALVDDRAPAAAARARSAAAAVVSSTAAAPSVICDDDAGGVHAVLAGDGLQRRPAPRATSRAGLRRASTRWVVPVGLPSSSTSGASIGSTSRSKRPSAHARCGARLRLEAEAGRSRRG